MFTVRHCPICGSNKKSVLYTADYSTNGLYPIGLYTVYRCNYCDMMFSDNSTSKDTLDNYYSTMSKYESSAVTSNERNEFIIKIVQQLTNKKSEIIDVGCGSGALLRILNKAGFKNLTAIEPARKCIDNIKKELNIDVYCGVIDTFETSKLFDLVSCLGVLEHVYNLKEFLLKIYSLMNNSGKLIIAVPDAENFNTFVKSPFQEFSLEHINYFTRNTLIKLLELCGFSLGDIYRLPFKMTQNIEQTLVAVAIKRSPKEDKLPEYIITSSKLADDLKDRLIKITNQVTNFVVWGVGHQALLHFRDKSLSNHVKYFVDMNKNYLGKSLYNKPIKEPQEDIFNYPILIMSYDYNKDILDTIKKMEIQYGKKATILNIFD